MAFTYHQIGFRLVKPWVRDMFNGMNFEDAPGGRSYYQT